MTIKTIRHFSYWAVLFVSVAGVLHSVYSIYRNEHINQRIDQLNRGKFVELQEHESPQLLLAWASYLKKKQRYTEAQSVLSKILNHNSREIRAITRYNLGNVYLTQAIDLAEAMQINEAVALASLAKQVYRQALSLNSRYWDAKYNLEVAIRLLPEMDRIIMKQDDPLPEKQVKLWATVPGFPRGLP